MKVEALLHIQRARLLPATCTPPHQPCTQLKQKSIESIYNIYNIYRCIHLSIYNIYNIVWPWQWTRASNKVSWLQQSIVTKIKIKMRSEWYNRQTKMRNIQDCKNKSLVSISISACISYENHISNIFLFCNYMIQRQGDKFAGPSESSSAALDIWKSKRKVKHLLNANDTKNLWTKGGTNKSYKFPNTWPWW